MGRLDVRKSPELLGAMLALRVIDRTIQKQVRVHTKRIAGPEFAKAIARRANTKLERRVLVDTAVVSVSNQNVRMQSAGKGRALSGGLNPKIDYPAVEFGANAKGVTYTRRSPKGKTHRVTRVMGTAFKPRRPGGYVFIPAAQEMAPRFGSLWVQTVVKTVGLALEGKQE